MSVGAQSVLSHATPAQPSGPCFHCGVNAGPDDPREDEHRFCCAGCLTAYRIIRDAGHGEFYLHREAYTPRPQEPRAEPLIIFEAARPRNQDGTVSATFIVEGLHCASCVWINEHVLRKIDGITSAEVRLSTGRCYITWQPDQVPLATIAKATARLGYSLIPLEETGEQVAATRGRALLQRMVVAGFFAGNMMLLSVALYAGYFDYMDRGTKNLLHLYAFLFALPVVLYSAMPIFRGALAAVRHRVPTMDLLTGLGISIAFVYSVVAALTERGEVFFDSITFVVFVLLVGRLVEDRLKARTLFLVERLAPARTSTVRVKTPDGVREMETKVVAPGDVLVLNVGEYVPVDGRLLTSRAETDTAILTGEFQPRLHKSGDTIVSGSRVIGGQIEITALSDAKTGVLGRILELADQSLKQEPRFVEIAARASRWFIGFVLAIGAFTFAFWFSRGVDLAVLHTVTLLIAACPCALNLAVPTVYTAALQQAFAQGCLVSGGAQLETLAHVEVLALDKTGTLTLGNLHVERTITFGERTASNARAIARALAEQAHVRHPVSDAFTRTDHTAHADELTPRQVMLTDARYEAGRGILGQTDDATYLLGSETFLREKGFRMPEPTSIAEAMERNALNLKGSAAHYVTIYLGEQATEGERTVVACFLLEDKVRPEAAEIVRDLGSDFRLMLLSGDTESNARTLAEELGLPEFRAPVRPDEKAALIKRLQGDGRTVAMLGDGINDAPALRQADCGISFAGASDLSVVRSDIVLVDANLTRLTSLFKLARLAQRKVRQNLLISFLYNSALLPLACLGYIAPVSAALFMALSSVTVLVNSILVRRALA